MSIENNGINPGAPSPQGPKSQDTANQQEPDAKKPVVPDSALSKGELHAKYSDEMAAETQKIESLEVEPADDDGGDF